MFDAKTTLVSVTDRLDMMFNMSVGCHDIVLGTQQCIACPVLDFISCNFTFYYAPTVVLRCGDVIVGNIEISPLQLFADENMFCNKSAMPVCWSEEVPADTCIIDK